MDDDHDTEGGAAAESPHGPGRAAPAIDLARLADKVHELMRQELRLERARGAVASVGRQQ